MSNNYDLNRHLARYLKEEPFYAALSRHIEKYPTNRIPTAGVCINPESGTFEMLYNPDFFEKLSDEEIMIVLKHEFMHLILEHVTGRMPDKSQMKMWNHATDLAINSEIFPKECKDSIKELWDMCLLPGKAPYDKFERGHSADYYFDEIKKMVEEQQSNGNGEGQGQGEGEGEGGNGKGESQSGEGNGNGGGFDDHEGWGEDGKNPIPQEVRELAKERLRQAMNEAANEANRSGSWGTISQSMRKDIIKRLQSKVDWKKVLRYFIKTSQKADKQNSVRKINRRFPYIHAGRKTNRTAKIAISIDQSGSVSDAMLMTFFAELDNLAELAEFTVIPFDDGVAEDKIYTWKKGQKKKAERVLCGGTNFDSPTKYVNERNFDGHIILTDMCAPKPIPSKCQRMWMTSEEDARNPYFKTNERVISVEVKQNR
jgi:predicted metal-dependent peptidase